MKLRWATRDDKDIIASFMIEASGGICEYLLSNVYATIPWYKLLSFEISKSDSALSFRNCQLVEINQEVVGVLCGYNILDFISQIDYIKDMEKKQKLREFYAITPKEKTLYIDTLCVASKYRGYGVGKFLLSKVINLLQYNLYENIALYVWQNNVVALSLYRSIGFQILEEKISHYPDFPIQQNRYLMNISVKEFRHFFTFKNRPHRL